MALANRRIVVVEDDDLVAEAITVPLRDAGYDVCGVAVSFDQGVALIQRSEPHLVIIDIGIVGSRSGIDLARDIRTTCDAQVIFCTGQFSNQLDGIESAGLLLKPFSADHLKAVVAAALERVASSGR